MHVLLLPPLDSLRFFEAAARHQGFARAAAELHVSAAACWSAGVRNHAWSMTSRLARAGVQPRRPATSPRVPLSRAGPYCGLGAILSAQTGGVRPSPAVGIVRARYDSRNNADANSIPPTTERAGAGYGSRPRRCPPRIRCQAATGSWTKSRQWETQRTLFSSARATMCPLAKVNGGWPFNDAWLRTSL